MPAIDGVKFRSKRHLLDSILASSAISTFSLYIERHDFHSAASCWNNPLRLSSGAPDPRPQRHGIPAAVRQTNGRMEPKQKFW